MGILLVFRNHQSVGIWLDLAEFEVGKSYGVISFFPCFLSTAKCMRNRKVVTSFPSRGDRK